MFVAGFLFILGALAALVVVALVLTYWRELFGAVAALIGLVVLIGVVLWFGENAVAINWPLWAGVAVVFAVVISGVKKLTDWREAREARKRAAEHAEIRRIADADWN